MQELKKLLRADLIKYKSTQILWLHLYIPLLGFVIFLSYYSFSSWTDVGKVSAYLQAISIVFPLFIGIITSIVADQEYSAGKYQNMLIASETKSLSILSKLIVCITLGILSTVFAVFGFYIGYSFIGENIYPLSINLAIVAILIGSNLCLYIFHLFVSLRFSKNVSIGLGLVGTLIAALFATGMGDGRWPFFPSSWSMRFIGAFLAKYQGSATAYLDPDLKLGIGVAIVLTVFAFVGVLKWFKNWGGTRTEE